MSSPVKSIELMLSVLSVLTMPLSAIYAQEAAEDSSRTVVDSVPAVDRSQQTDSTSDTLIPTTPTYTIDSLKPVVTLLLAEPVVTGNTTERWMGPFVSALLTFRMGAWHQVAMVGTDTTHNAHAYDNVPDRAAQLQKYQELAQVQHATHLLLPSVKKSADGKSVQVALSLYAVQEARLIATTEAGGAIESVAEAIETGVSRILLKTGVDPSKAAIRFISTPVLGNIRSQRAISDALSLPTSTIAEILKQAEELKSIYERDSKAFLAGYLSALAYSRSNQFSLAASVLETVIITLGPYNASLYPLTAHFYLRADKPNEALKVVTIAEKMGLASMGLLIEKALILETMERWDEADAAFNRVIRADSANVRALVYLVKNANAHKKYSEALDLATRFTTSHPDNVTILLEMGKSLLNLQRSDEAISAVQKALVLDPVNPEGLMALGDLYMLRTECDKAIEYFLRAIDIGTHTAAPYINAAYCYITKGSPIKALELLKRVETQYYGNTGIQRAMGLAAFAAEDKATAKRYLSQYVQNQSADTTVLLRLANIYKVEGDSKNALGYLQKAHEIAPTDSAISAQIAELSAKRERIHAVGLRSDAPTKDRGRSLRLSIGIGTGVICLATLAGGILFDAQVRSNGAAYHAAQSKETVDKLHTEIGNGRLLRNVLYATSAVCAAGCSVTWLIPGKK